MKKLVVYFVILHTAMLLITGFGIWFILKQFFPQILIGSYYIVPLFFYILGLIFILQFRQTPREAAKMVNMHLMTRSIKIFTSLGVILIYWALDKTNARNFAIIFIIFYLVTLIWETYIYLRIEKYIKYKDEQEKPPAERIEQ